MYWRMETSCSHNTFWNVTTALIPFSFVEWNLWSRWSPSLVFGVSGFVPIYCICLTRWIQFSVCLLNDENTFTDTDHVNDGYKWKLSRSLLMQHEHITVDIIDLLLKDVYYIEYISKQYLDYVYEPHFVDSWNERY